jgi:hypothetical protein
MDAHLENSSYQLFEPLLCQQHASLSRRTCPVLVEQAHMAELSNYLATSAEQWTIRALLEGPYIGPLVPPFAEPRLHVRDRVQPRGGSGVL